MFGGGEALIGALLVILVVFLVIRVAVLWYWKIDVIVKTLEDIRSELKKLPKAEGFK